MNQEISADHADELSALEHLVQKVEEGATKLKSKVFTRDMRESVVAGAFGIGSFIGLFFAKNWIDWSGYLALAIAGVVIPATLWRARKRSVIGVSAGDFLDFVDMEIDFVRRQVRLLRTVLWWYLLPFSAGIALLTLGLIDRPYERADLIVIAIVFAWVSATYAWVWCLNQRACKEHLEPLLRYYKDMGDTLRGGDDLVPDHAGPPVEFLNSSAPTKVTARQKRIGIALTLTFALATIAFGFAMMNWFDHRTGKFVAFSSPVVAVLVAYVTRVWRKTSDELPKDE